MYRQAAPLPHGCALHVPTSMWEVSAAAEKQLLSSLVASGDGREEPVLRSMLPCAVDGARDKGCFLWSLSRR